jgi:hypothetical protein
MPTGYTGSRLPDRDIAQADVHLASPYRGNRTVANPRHPRGAGPRSQPPRMCDVSRSSPVNPNGAQVEGLRPDVPSTQPLLTNVKLAVEPARTALPLDAHRSVGVAAWRLRSLWQLAPVLVGPRVIAQSLWSDSAKVIRRHYTWLWIRPRINCRRVPLN